MKKAFFLSAIFGAFFLMINSSFAQYPEFAPVGAEWNYTEYQVTGGLSVRKITSDAETIRFGKNCKHLFSESFGDFYAYRDSLKMYVSYPADSSWHILYDFTKNPGQYFYAHEPFELADSIFIGVTGKGDTIINGYTLPYIITVSFLPFFHFNGKAILNIGSESYFVPPHPLADPFPSGLRCYEDNIIGLYQVVSPCDTLITVGISNLFDDDGIRIVPNPMVETVQIIFNDPSERLLDFTIRNSTGELMMEKKNSSSSGGSYEFNSNSLAPGIYFAAVHSDKKQYLLKLVKF